MAKTLTKTSLDVSGMKSQDVKRFTDFIDDETTDGCWPWKGSKDRDGYGQFWFNGRVYGAHRIALALFKGVVTDRKRVRTCNRHDCVCPRHNMRNGNGHGNGD